MANEIEALRDMINGIKVAMLTTVDQDGTLRSRPMMTQQAEFDGDLWFFTADNTDKVPEINKEHRVSISYASPSDNRYVSVTGTAHFLKDQAKMRELWTPLFKAWFPEGLEDPHLALLKVRVESAEYWDSGPSNKLIQFAGVVKAAVTGKPYEGGENEKLNLNK